MKKIEINQQMLNKFENFTAFVVIFETDNDTWLRVFSGFYDAITTFNKFVAERPSNFEDCEIFEDSEGFIIQNKYGSVSCELIAKILE